MALVDYPDSDNEASGPKSLPTPQSQRIKLQIKNEQSTTSRKRKFRSFAESSPSNKPLPPPLPSTFHSLYATNIRTSISDDPSLHEGRKRQVRHIEGNWPTHVYLEWFPSREESGILQNVIRMVEARGPPKAILSPSSKVHNLLQSELGAQLPLHISLSVPLMLRTEHRAVFMQKLEHAIECAGVKPFRVHVTGLDWMPNSEKTRWFLVLRLGRPGNDSLNLLLAMTNCIARDSGLEMLYATQDVKKDGDSDKDLRIDKLSAGRTRVIDFKYRRLTTKILADYTSKFHLSIAWQLEEPGGKKLEIVGALKSVESLSISCNCLKVKIGNAIHNVTLQERRLSEQALGEM